jgi:hypothetical protein
VTDAKSTSVTVSVTINAALAISPSAVTLMVGDTQGFGATGGVSPYTFTTAAGNGSISSTTYTAPNSAGSATVRVTDNLGNTSDCAVTINAALAISPSSWTMAVNNQKQFSASGGVGSDTLSKVSGVGSVSGTTYSAGTSTGTAVVRFTDSASPTPHTIDANITVNAALAISPTSVSVAALATTGFTASGGATPYTYSVQSGGGSISGSTYTAPAASGTATVRVTDAANNTSDCTVTITDVTPTSIAYKYPSSGTAGTIALTQSTAISPSATPTVGGGAPTSWTISCTVALPGTVSMSTSTGVFTGNPGACSSYSSTCTVTGTNSAGSAHVDVPVTCN